MPPDSGWYLYAFLSARAVPPMEGIDGRSPLKLVSEADVVALVSAVPLSEFGEGALRLNLENPTWLEEKVRRHEAIVESALARGAVLPMRFGAVFRELGRIRRLMRSNGRLLRASLRFLRDKEEWGLKAYLDRRALQSAVLRSGSGFADSTGEAPHLSAGQAFFVRKRSEGAAVRCARRRADALVRSVSAVVQQAAVRVERVHGVVPTGPRGEDIVLNLACLLTRRRVKGFLSDVVAPWNDAHAANGLRLVASGPWPPYHFAPQLEDA